MSMEASLAQRLRIDRIDLAEVYEEMRRLPNGAGAARQISDAIDALDQAILRCPTSPPASREEQR